MFWRHLKSELWKLYGKKRTYIGFVAFLLAQNAMLLAFKFTRWQSDVQRVLAGNGYIAEEYISALTVAVVMLIPQTMLLMPLYASLVGGDLVAKEAEDGTLRMMLCRPISRLRLLMAKWVAGLVFSASLVLALGGTALASASIWFPWKSMFVFAPGMLFSAMDANEGFRLYLTSHLLMTLNSTVILGLAFMFSCLNIKPAAATILALTYLFINLVMESIPFFDRYEEWFLPHHFRVWLLVYSNPTPWDRVGASLCVLGAFCVTTFIIGAAVFQTRDIKS